MTGAGTLGLLLLKHAVLAHVIDFGYSASRRSHYGFWWLALVLYCLAEIVGTMFVLSEFPLQAVSALLLVETLGLSLSAMLERGVPLNQLLIRHLLCEFGMIAVYLLMVGYLVSL